MSVILLAHGSRHPLAAAGLEELRAEVERAAGPTQVAYLDLQEPRLTDVAEPGDTVVPLLFTNAFHARHDVPAAAAGLGVQLTAPLGLDDAIARILAAEVRFPQVIIYAVGSSVPGANDAVRACANRVAELSGADVSVAFATCAPFLPDDAEAQIIPLFVTHGLLLDRLRSSCFEPPLPLSSALAPAVLSLVNISS